LCFFFLICFQCGYLRKTEARKANREFIVHQIWIAFSTIRKEKWKTRLCPSITWESRGRQDFA
jgi:hypothetical protein